MHHHQPENPTPGVRGPVVGSSDDMLDSLPLHLPPQVRAVPFQPFLGGIGGHVAHRLTFDLLSRRLNPSCHHPAFDGFVFVHAQSLEDVLDPLASKHPHHGIFQRHVVNQATATRQTLCEFGDGGVMGLERMPLGNDDDNGLRIVGTKPRCGSACQDFRRGYDHGLWVKAALFDDGLELLQTVPEVGHQQHGKRSGWFGEATSRWMPKFR